MFGLNNKEVKDTSIPEEEIQETSSEDIEEAPIQDVEGLDATKEDIEEMNEELPEDFPKEDQGLVLGENEELVEVNGVTKIKVTNPEDGTTRFK